MIASPAVRRTTVVALAALLCVPASGAVATTAQGAAAPRGSGLPTVRLTADPGQRSARSVRGASPVRSATVRVPKGPARRWRVRGWHTNGFAQVGATWRGGDPVLQARSRSAGQRWGSWQELDAQGDGPDRGTGEGRRGVHGADLWWAGDSRDVQVRVRGAGYRRLKIVLIDPGDEPSDARPTARPGQNVSRAGARRARPRSAPRPRVFLRRAWGANESWRERPRFNRRLKTVHVHHTVNSNSYRRRDVPAMIRGMYRYHVFSLGWSDIGYNFLVDKFGRIWAGRYGGPGRKVRGAHTLGFNHNSTGISAIGNFETGWPPQKMRFAITKLAAWKLDKAGLRPRGSGRVSSTGSDRYRAGSHPRLPRIAGHRDTNQTACPGIRLYRKLPGIRKYAQRRANRWS